MPEIFLSYRRTDAAATAGRLYDRLCERFGAEQVFRDIDTIEAGENFERLIEAAIEGANAVLVLIGPHWLDAQAGNGKPRLEDPSDYVRREIELALKAGTLVVPVLVDDAVIPQAARLPASIRELAARNAVELSQRRWHADTEALIEQLLTHGIPPGEAGARAGISPRPVHQVVLTALAQFVPNVFSLLRQPRVFLLARSHGRGSELTSAFVFFALSVLLGVAILLAAYTPVQPPVSFGFAVLVAGLLGTLGVSVPLWIGWRAVGAARPYARVLAILLHQMGVLHLACFIAISLIVSALDLVSRDIVPRTIAEAMAPGGSLRSAIDGIRGRFEPLAAAGGLRIGLVLGAAVIVASLGWLLCSWGAYRDALGLSRARSLGAAALAGLVLVAACALVGLVAR